MRTILTWAAEQGRVIGLNYIEINPYAIGRPKGGLLPRGRINLDPVYIRDVLTRVAACSRGENPVYLGVEGSRGRRAATFFVPVLGPSVAEIQREAEVAKISARRRNQRNHSSDFYSGNAENLPLPPSGTEGSKKEKSRPRHEAKDESSHPKPETKDESSHPRHAAKQPRFARPSGLPAVPAGWEEVYGDLKGLVEGLPAPDRFSEAALRSLLAKSPVGVDEAMGLLTEAAKDAASRPGTRSVRAYALSVLRPGSAMADALRTRLFRPSEATGDEKADTVAEDLAEAVEALVAAEVTPSQAMTLAAGAAASVPDVQPRYLVAEAVAILGQRNVKISNPGGYLRGIFARINQDPRLLGRARARQQADQRAGSSPWAKSLHPGLRSMPRALEAFDKWQRLRASAPSPKSAGYLVHHDQEREARAALLALAETALGPNAEALRAELRQRLEASDMKEGSLVWKRAWQHHWARAISTACNLDLGN